MGIVRSGVCVCVCVPVGTEAKSVGRKGDRSAANRSGIQKVDNYGFCLAKSVGRKGDRSAATDLAFRRLAIMVFAWFQV